MTKIEKEKIADQIMNLLIQLTNYIEVPEPAEKLVKMLTSRNVERRSRDFPRTSSSSTPK